jgi:peroxiredoxin
MPPIAIGQPAPSFSLPSGQGPTVSLDEYRGRSHVILWITKGMGCPFCRSQMSQLALGYPRFKALGAEVLQVTPSPPARAAFYTQRFRVPFIYLCDPDYRVHRQWGLEVRSHSLGWYAKSLVTAARTTMPTSDLGDPRVSLGEVKTNLHDTDMGFFLIDRAGVVRYALSGTYMGAEAALPRGIPSSEEIVREIERAS